jgi:hypothetical protein
MWAKDTLPKDKKDGEVQAFNSIDGEQLPLHSLPRHPVKSSCASIASAVLNQFGLRFEQFPFSPNVKDQGNFIPPQIRLRPESPPV